MRLDFFLFGGLQLVELSLSAQAQFADALLHLKAGELRLIENKLALDRDALVNRGLAGRNMELRLHFDVSVEDGSRGVRCEAQKILDPGAIHIHVEGDVVADAVQASIVACLQNAHNRALRREVRAVQGGLDGLEPCVAVGSVHARMKVGVKHHGVAEARELEVGSIGLAVDGEIAQRALVTSGRIQDAGDAFEDGQIGVIEGVVAADWSCCRGRRRPTGQSCRSEWMAPGGVGFCN